jgi:HAD superfamily phosphoserine phosphatase-like hydrolase
MDNNNQRRQFAVFDIDGTIARTSLLQQLVRVLVSRGKIGLGPAQQIETMLHDFRQRIADDDFGDYMKKAVDIMFSSMPKGLSLEEYDEMIDVVVKSSLTHTYVYTRQLIQTLKHNNFFLISISGSELRTVSTFSKALGFDAWVGQVQYLDDGKKLTGEVRALGQPKDKILQTIINKFNLDTKGSMAVGDTSSDVSILNMVEQPIVFNPNQALFKKARENGWMTVVERKDMVYGLTFENNQYVLKQVNV